MESLSSLLSLDCERLSSLNLKLITRRGQLTAFSFFFLKLKKDRFFFFFSRSLIEPVSEAEQLSSTSERWEAKVLDTFSVGRRLSAVSLALVWRLAPDPGPAPACEDRRNVDYVLIEFMAPLTHSWYVWTGTGTLDTNVHITAAGLVLVYTSFCPCQWSSQNIVWVGTSRGGGDN